MSDVRNSPSGPLVEITDGAVTVLLDVPIVSAGGNTTTTFYDIDVSATPLAPLTANSAILVNPTTNLHGSPGVGPANSAFVAMARVVSLNVVRVYIFNNNSVSPLAATQMAFTRF